MQPALQPTLYESLEALPEGMTGEILNGQLHTHLRLSGAHVNVGSMLGAELISPEPRPGNLLAASATGLGVNAVKLAVDRLPWSIRMRKRKRRIARIGANPFARIRVIRRFFWED